MTSGIACEEISFKIKCDLIYLRFALIVAKSFLASHILPDIVGISHWVGAHNHNVPLLAQCIAELWCG